MNELQRQAYLSALGIDNYMPRCALAYAPASVQCALPDVRELSNRAAEPAISSSRAAVVGMADRPVSIKSLTDNLTEPKDVLGLDDKANSSASDSKVEEVLGAFGAGSSKKKEEKLSLKEPESLNAATDLRPKFSLTIWRVSPDLMVVDTRDLQQALPTERLLVNILMALGYQLPSLPKANVLKWPMIDNDLGGQGVEDARDMLHAFLDAELLLDPVKHLLLMGSAAATYILPPSHIYPEVIHSQLASANPIILESLATPLVVTPSLVDILLEPSLKAQVWRLIQPLIVKR